VKTARDWNSAKQTSCFCTAFLAVGTQGFNFA
jgi:hypothetical protein